ncbi:Unknown protein sequence [Pseudomonas coronafaciens pv. oryzae]|nr:Unknown protein sequence [Pseudomonas coronafaciens pv. oryzae]
MTAQRKREYQSFAVIAQGHPFGKMLTKVLSLFAEHLERLW